MPASLRCPTSLSAPGEVGVLDKTTEGLARGWGTVAVIAALPSLGAIAPPVGATRNFPFRIFGRNLASGLMGPRS